MRETGLCAILGDLEGHDPHLLMTSLTNDLNGRPTWVEIDLDALAGNFLQRRELVGPDISVMAVVKASAYGHGAARCAQRLAMEGADQFGVALPEEGIELRESLIAEPIVCLGGFWQGQASLCVQHQLTPVVY